MTFIAAKVHEQGQDFVVFLVKDRVLDSPQDAAEALAFASAEFGGVRSVLWGEYRGRTLGPPDIVRFLEGVGFDQLPWHEYRLAA